LGGYAGPEGRFGRQATGAEPGVLGWGFAFVGHAEFGTVIRGEQFCFGFVVCGGRNDVALQVV